jgi:hypothetical protein
MITRAPCKRQQAAIAAPKQNTSGTVFSDQTSALQGSSRLAVTAAHNIPTSCHCSNVLGMICGWLSNWLAGTPRPLRYHVVAAAGFGNLNSLPLLIATAICTQDSLPFQQGEPMILDRRGSCQAPLSCPTPVPLHLQLWGTSAAAWAMGTSQSAPPPHRCSHVSFIAAASLGLFLCGMLARFLSANPFLAPQECLCFAVLQTRWPYGC